MDSVVYFQDDVAWCVQKAKGRAKWKQIFLVADWKIFLCIFCSVFPLVFVVYGFNGFERRPYDIWTSAFLVTRTISLTPSPLNPERNSLRFFYLYFVCITFFFMSIFGSFWFIIITNPFNEHQISNFEEIVNANFRLVAEEELKQFLVARNMVNVARALFFDSSLNSFIFLCIS